MQYDQHLCKKYYDTDIQMEGHMKTQGDNHLHARHVGEVGPVAGPCLDLQATEL